MLNSYRPNETKLSHKVDVTIMLFEYKAKFRFQFNGSIKGGNVLTNFLDGSNILYELQQGAECLIGDYEFLGEEEHLEITLVDEDGYLYMDIFEVKELENMITSLQIAEIEILEEE